MGKIVSRLGLAKDQAIESIRARPLIIVGIIVLALLLIFFWQAFVVLAILIGLVLIFLKLKYRQTPLKDLLAEKKIILSEIKLLERDYMKRKMSKEDFIGIFRRKQKEIIGLEALIDQRFNKEKLPSKKDSAVQEITAKKRHIVESILTDKRRTLREMEIAQKMYFKRKIDVATYQKLIMDKREKLIGFEAKLKQIYGEESISHVLDDLKKRLANVEKQRIDEAKKKDQAVSDKEREIAEQIAEQLKYFK
jgi:hypothetical protein